MRIIPVVAMSIALKPVSSRDQKAAWRSLRLDYEDRDYYAGSFDLRLRISTMG